MPINWPPASAPPWPPPEISPTWFSCSCLLAFVQAMSEGPYLIAAPTPAEHNQFFRDARCDHGHTVTGRMAIIGGVRYPIAICDDSIHKDVLVLWPPYYCGAGSANYEFVG